MLQRRAVYRAVAVTLLSAALAAHRTQLGPSEPAVFYGALCLWGALSYFGCAGVFHRLGRRVAVLMVMLSLAQFFGLDPGIWFALIRKVPERILTLAHDNLLICKFGACAAGVAYAACTDLLHEARIRSVLQRQSGSPRPSPLP